MSKRVPDDLGSVNQRQVRRFERKVLQKMFKGEHPSSTYWHHENSAGVCGNCSQAAEYRYDPHAAVLWELEEPENREKYAELGFVPAFPPRPPEASTCAACCWKYYLKATANA